MRRREREGEEGETGDVNSDDEHTHKIKKLIFVINTVRCPGQHRHFALKALLRGRRGFHLLQFEIDPRLDSNPQPNSHEANMLTISHHHPCYIGKV